MELVLGVGGKFNCLVIDEIDGVFTVGFFVFWRSGGRVAGIVVYGIFCVFF